MKKTVLSLAMLGTMAIAQEIDAYELTLEETIKRDIAKDFSTEMVLTIDNKDVENVKDMEEFEKEINKSFEKLEGFEIDENIAGFNEKTLKEMEDFKICTQEVMVVYKKDPLSGKCQRVILKDGCEIDSYMKKDHYAAKQENCVPDLD